MTRIRKHLTSIPHDPEWVDAYIYFIENTPSPRSNYDCHHILMQSVFPQFKSLARNPWNEKKLSYADHLVAHYLLRRATPCGPTAAAFRFMVGLRYNELIASGYDEDLLAEIAADFELARLQLEPTTAGRIHIYRDDERMTCIPEDLPEAENEGWTTTYPEQQWIFRDEEEKRVLKSELGQYLAEGWELGRVYVHSEETLRKKSVAALAHHSRIANTPGAYNYLPHGDNHHYRMTGVSPEIREKIRKSLEGRKQTDSHVEARRQSMRGKHWTWNEESRKAKSLSMTGPLHPNWGKSSGALGHVHSEETRAQMSAAHKRRYEDNPASFMNKPKGADHYAYGKERPEETRTKISESLKGHKQSDETKIKRKRSLAVSKFPVLDGPMQEALLHYVHATEEERPGIYKGIRGSARLIASGLDHIVSGTWATIDERYWRGARVWLYCKSGLPAEFLRSNFPVLTNLEESTYGTIKS